MPYTLTERRSDEGTGAPDADILIVTDHFGDSLELHIIPIGVYVLCGDARGHRQDVAIYDGDVVALLQSLAKIDPALLAEAGLALIEDGVPA